MSEVKTQQPQNIRGKVILFCVCILAFLLSMLIEDPGGVSKNVSFFLGYGSFLLLLSIFDKRKWVKKMTLIIGAPLILFVSIVPYLAGILGVSFLFVSIGLVTTYLSGSLLPIVIGMPLPLPAQVYIILTFSSILATSFGDKLIKAYHYVQHKDYRGFSEKLSLLLVNQSKIKYFIYMLYFILLLVLNFFSFINRPVFEEGLNLAILQSFGTYLAFDRVVSNWKLFINY